jgi:hypothetical protein
MRSCVACIQNFVYACGVGLTYVYVGLLFYGIVSGNRGHVTGEHSAPFVKKSSDQATSFPISAFAGSDM